MYFLAESSMAFIKALKGIHKPGRLRPDLDEDPERMLITFTVDTKLLERVKTVGDKSGFKEYPERLSEQAASSEDKITQLRAATEKDLEGLINSKLSMSQ